MTYTIVTSSTPEFLPGVEALSNSIKANFPEAELHCFFYSKGQTDYVLPEGVNYIHEAPHFGMLTDNGREYRHGMIVGPDMYARILIPKHFTGRVYYMDADCVVLKKFPELWDLDMEGYPTACVHTSDNNTNTPYNQGWPGGNGYDDMASGTFLLDCEAWNNLNLIDKIYDVMKLESEGEIAKFPVNVESAMGYVHAGKFLHLDSCYQNICMYRSLSQSDKVVHYVGPKPWQIDNHNLKYFASHYADIWQAYHDNHIELAHLLQSKLPDVHLL